MGNIRLFIMFLNTYNVMNSILTTWSKWLRTLRQNRSYCDWTLWTLLDTKNFLTQQCFTDWTCSPATGRTSVWTLGAHNGSRPLYTRPHGGPGQHTPEPFPSHWASGLRATEPSWPPLHTLTPLRLYKQHRRLTLAVC